MELVAYYIENVLPHVKRQRILNCLRPEYRSIEEQWREFHESQAPSVVCIGGRQIEKTHNLLLRAILQNDSHAIIISRFFRDLHEYFLSMLNDLNQIYYVRRTYWYIVFRLFDRVFYFMYPRMIVRGMRFEPSVVYYDEPETYDEELPHIRSILAPFCKQEIAVGTPFKLGLTHFKKWYETAEKKIKITHKEFEELKN